MKRLLALALTLSILTALSFPTLAKDVPSGPYVKVSDVALTFMIGDEVVARYNKGESVAKPYLWPLTTVGGLPVTRGWPMTEKAPGGSEDHVHQKSAWFCHGDVIPDGIEIKEKIKGVTGVDFWSENKAAGKIVCTSVGTPKADMTRVVSIPTHNEWRMGDGTKILDEDRTIHFHDLGTARLFIFDIDLHASVCGITFGDTKEGSFGVRVNDVLREEVGEGKKRTKGTGKLENAEGKTGEASVWGQKSLWCDYSGPVDGKKVGIAIFDDSANAYPACWHSRGYGLHAANPFGRVKSGFPGMRGKTELVRLAKGDHLKLRYGIFIHSGDAKEGKVAEAYEKFMKLK